MRTRHDVGGSAKVGRCGLAFIQTAGDARMKRTMLCAHAGRLLQTGRVAEARKSWATGAAHVNNSGEVEELRH